MTYEVQQTRWDALVRRVSGSIGPGSRVSETISELFPVLEVENTTPELIALSGWRTAWQSTERPPSAGNESASALHNPPASGVIATVTQVILRATLANTIVQMETEISTIGGTQVAGLFRDIRFGTGRDTTLTVTSNDASSVGGGLRIFVGTDIVSIRDDNGIAVLTPNTSLRVGTVTVNVGFTVNYFWRERPAQPAELQF